MNWSYQFIDYSVHPAYKFLCPIMDLWVEAIRGDSLPHRDDFRIEELSEHSECFYLTEFKDRKTSFLKMGKQISDSLETCSSSESVMLKEIDCPPIRHLTFLFQEIRMVRLPAISGYQSIYGGPTTFGLHLPLRGDDRNCVDFVFGAFLGQEKYKHQYAAQRRLRGENPFVESLLKSVG